MQAVQQSLFTVPSVQSPLVYVGGKSRVTRLLSSYMPAGVTDVVSPFLGGGGFELYLAAQGIRVHGYDNFPPLVNFWQHMLTQPSAVVAGVSKYLPPHKYYHELYDRYYDIPDPMEQAVAYWVLNKGSFSGKVFSGASVNLAYRWTRYKPSHFNKFRYFNSPALSVSCADFRESLSRHDSEFAYCDPPYVGRESFYGDGTVKVFPHDALADILKSRRGDWLLSYNDVQLIRDLYPAGEFRYIKPQWTYSINSVGGQSASNELLIMPR